MMKPSMNKKKMNKMTKMYKSMKNGIKMTYRILSLPKLISKS